jgi:hypothetical protein
MERIEPAPEPPDRDGVPRTLFMFVWAALVVVAEVVLVALAQAAWAVVLAIASVLVLGGIVLWAIELDLQPYVARRRGDGDGPAHTGVPPAWSGPPGHRRVLLLASEPVSAAALSPTLGPDTAVLVVAPALRRTRLENWTSDSDEPIKRARRIQEATTEALQRAHIPSGGHVGSRDPMVAIDDALRFFDADEIVLALRTRGRRLRAEVERRFGRKTIELAPEGA